MKLPHTVLTLKPWPLLLVAVTTCLPSCSGTLTRDYPDHRSTYVRRVPFATRFSRPSYAPIPPARPPSAYRRTVNLAQAQFESRRRALLQRFVDDFHRHGLGDFEKKPELASFRRIAAGLFALNMERIHRKAHPGAPPLFNPTVPPDFPQRVEAFTRTIRKFAVSGTNKGLWSEPGDYDFYMKEMVSLLYLFSRDRDLLSDNAAFNIIDRGLSRDAVQSRRHPMTFLVAIPLFAPLLEYPETENHVFMILSSVYLANQWIARNPRNDRRLTQGKYRDRKRYAEAGRKVEDRILQACGRVLHQGFWEVNARPYQAMSAHALMNLHAFAAAKRVRVGARNALDYLAAKFAFQSLEMKRFAPFRRNAGYADRVDLYANDGIVFMFGVLAGGHSWPTGFGGTGNAPGHALWASLLPYRVPETIHHFMLDKHTGFWSRMQTRYNSENYRAGHPGEYFRSDGLPYRRPETQQSVPELYFVTPRFMNVSGGSFQRYPILGDAVIARRGAHDLDFLSRPHALIPRGHVGSWKNIKAMAREVMLMRGERRFWTSDNIGTYKSFTYGYLNGDDADRHLDSPVSLPTSWRNHLYRQDGRDQFFDNGRSRARYSFVDLSQVERYGFYVVLGRVSKSYNRPGYRHFARGFWEIVPRERFTTVSELKDHVLEQNPAHRFSDSVIERYRYYRYTMTTGETVELDDLAGFRDGRCRNPIRNVWPRGVYPDRDAPLDLSRTVVDRCDQRAIARMPLMEVSEVDENYDFTGRVFASAPGDGQVWVHNPFLRTSLHLDSRNYRRPQRREK